MHPAVGCHYFPPGLQLPPFGRYQVIMLGDRGTRVNNLPKVVTQRCLEQDLNPRPTDRKPKSLTVAPPRHSNSIPAESGDGDKTRTEKRIGKATVTSVVSGRRCLDATADACARALSNRGARREHVRVLATCILYTGRIQRPTLALLFRTIRNAPCLLNPSMGTMAPSQMEKIMTAHCVGRTMPGGLRRLRAGEYCVRSPQHTALHTSPNSRRRDATALRTCPGMGRRATAALSQTPLR